MFCSNCGAETTGKFCSNCGQLLASATPEPGGDTKEWQPAGPSIPEETTANTAEIRFSKVDESIKRRSQSSVAQMQQSNPPAQSVNRASASPSRPPRRRTASAQPKLKKTGRRRFSAATLVGVGISNLLRYLTIACMAALTLSTASALWSRRNALGSLTAMVSESNYALYIYVGLGLSLILYGAFSCLWIYSRRRIADGRKMHHYDTGRGLVSFLFWGLTSFFAAVIIVQLPASPDYLRGVSQVLLVFFVNRNVNLTLAAIGAILCILRGVKFH